MHVACPSRFAQAEDEVGNAEAIPGPLFTTWSYWNLAGCTRGALTGPGSRLGGQALANKPTTFLKSAAQCQVLEASSDTDSDASVRVSHALPMA